MAAISDTTDLKMKGEVALITIDSPPVNALSHAMRQGLMEALQTVLADPAAKVIVLMCAGRSFIAGADLKEIAQPEASPRAIDIINTIESAPKPVIAAIHGTALGGGFEVALGCHYRIAVPTAKCGLPEVSLGLLPGAGGTQRLTRVVGPEKALEIIVGGAPLSAQTCLELGLIDALITEFDFHDDAINFARKVLAENRPLRKIRDMNDTVLAARGKPEIFTEFRSKNPRKFRGFKAPGNIVRAIEAAVNEPFDQGMQTEWRLFLELLHSPEAIAQRYAFFAERGASKIPDVGGHTPILAINRVGVVGAGLMGGGIAMSFANAGLAVKLTDVQPEALERGLATIRQNYESNVRSGRVSAEDAQKRINQIKGVTLPELNDCDLIVEAVFENLQVKKDVFAQLDAIAKPNAILATNTSALDIDEIATSVKRPEFVIGLHFFSPANIMRLVEVVRAEQTSKAVIATSMQLAKRLGKVGVLVRVAPGFVGNRMLHARQQQIDELLLDGASPWDIDRVLTDFGMPMGPFAMSDLAGLDLAGRSADKGERLFDMLSAAGRKGQKTRAGFYDYDERRQRTPSRVTDEIVAQFRAKRGRTPRVISDLEILERSIFAMINEGAKILDEGKAIRASDIDMVWVHGYGWPVYRGGPMFYADRVGLRNVVAKLKQYQLAVSPLLERLAAEDGHFIDA